MDWLSLIPIFLQLAEAAPKIIAAWESSPTNALKAVAAVVQQTPIANILAQIGAVVFPKVAPELQAAAAALVATHKNNTAWVQSGLNLLASTGYFTLSPPLVVDGVYGPKTFAAVEAIQAKLGMPVNGMVADAEYNAIQALLTKLG